MGENTHPVVPTPFAPLSCASILSLHINVSTSQILIHPRTEPDTIYIIWTKTTGLHTGFGSF